MFHYKSCLFLQQEDRNDGRAVTNVESAAAANQKRMNADPLEMMLSNLGYRIIRSSSSTRESDAEEEEEDGDGNNMQCRPF